MEKRANYTKLDLLNKVFLPSYKGYDPEDVDTYLDKIIEDYEYFNSKIKSLESLIGNLKDENIKLKETIKTIKSRPDLNKKVKENDISLTSLDIDYSKNSTLDNLDLLRRIDVYEKVLYKHGIDPSKLK